MSSKRNSKSRTQCFRSPKLSAAFIWWNSSAITNTFRSICVSQQHSFAPRSRCSSGSIVTKLWGGRRELNPRQRQVGVFLLATVSRLALGLTHPPIKWTKRPGREAEHSFPLGIEVQTAWSYISTPSWVFIASCLLKVGIRFLCAYICDVTFPRRWFKSRSSGFWHRVMMR
jgi:hypothetical protein